MTATTNAREIMDRLAIVSCVVFGLIYFEEKIDFAGKIEIVIHFLFEKMSLQLKAKWGGLIETVYSQPDGASHDNEYLSMLINVLNELEKTTTAQALLDALTFFSQKDCDFLCSPLLDSLTKFSVERAAEDNNMDAVRFFIERRVNPVDNDRSLAWACAHENKEMINYLTPFFNKDSRGINDATQACVAYDQLESLKILVSLYGIICLCQSTIKLAFLNNNLKFIEYIHSVNLQGIRTLMQNMNAYRNTLLSKRDNMEAVHFLVSKGYLINNIPMWIERAAHSNLVKTFKYLTSVNPVLGDSVRIAIKNNNMHIIKYIIEEMKQPVTTEYMTVAIDNNSEIFVQYFLGKKSDTTTIIEEGLVCVVRGQKRKLAELLRLELCKNSYV